MVWFVGLVEENFNKKKVLFSHMQTKLIYQKKKVKHDRKKHFSINGWKMLEKV
jgi:hypothetical protein